MLRLLIVLGEGGHSKEMLTLVRLLGDAYEYHYVITDQDALSETKLETHGPIHRVVRPRNKEDSILRALPKLARCAGQSLGILLRAKPHAVIHCGPAVAIPMSILARAMNKPVIFVETGSRIHRLSLTGRLMRRLASLYFVQWPELLAVCPKGRYAGRLF
jgi:beta-1,4-N-acetylglucosaminyltransferase